MGFIVDVDTNKNEDRLIAHLSNHDLKLTVNLTHDSHNIYVRPAYDDIRSIQEDWSKFTIPAIKRWLDSIAKNNSSTHSQRSASSIMNVLDQCRYLQQNYSQIAHLFSEGNRDDTIDKLIVFGMS